MNRLAADEVTAIEVDSAQAVVLAEQLLQLGVKADVLRSPDVAVRAVRTRLGLSQSEFALRFGLQKDTVQNWEQGRGTPDATTRTLLAIIDRNPQVVDAVMSDGDDATAAVGLSFKQPVKRG